jgi:methylphosphotriester-DNA--protein-cysteine methyltransferase
LEAANVLWKSNLFQKVGIVTFGYKPVTVKTLRSFIVLFLFVACASQSSDAQTVYITKTGKKYHRASCQYLKKSQYAIAIKEAVDREYTPCSVCEPGRPSQQKSPVLKQKHAEIKPKDGVEKLTESKSQAQSKQCSGTTKAGTRCKRMTTSTTGRCYQHQ